MAGLTLGGGVTWNNSSTVTESAAVTTSVTSLSDVLRGASNWISYLDVTGQPWWPLGFRIATWWVPMLLTGLVAAAGLAGLIIRVPAGRPEGRDWALAPARPAVRIAERRFLLRLGKGDARPKIAAVFNLEILTVASVLGLTL